MPSQIFSQGQGSLCEQLPETPMGDGFGSGLSTTQIMALADAIDIDHTEWMSQAMTRYSE